MPDTAALTTLTAQYCHRLDDGQFDALLDLFGSDATIEFRGEAPCGREELSGFFTTIATATNGARHLCVNPEFTVNNASATGVMDFMLAYVDGKPPMLGRYHDTYRKTDGRWLFATRRIIPAG
jgi:hypothetical protein